MLIDTLKKNLTQQCNNALLRERFTIQQRSNNAIMIDEHALNNFSSNDYLSLATHPNVKKAFIQGVEQYGLGSGASALVSGFYTPHHLLEEKFAEFLNRERAILFNSGYLANVGVITTFANRDTNIISDKLCHASILDGIILSRAKHHRYHHNNVAHCETLLKQLQKKCLVVTESVFSMEGDISPIDKLAALAKQYSTTLIVDDAHGIGVLGNQGRGICEHYHLTQEDVPCLVTPFGKALGSMGAIVSGKKLFIDGLMQFANSYRYTTALPPAIALASIEALNIITNETWRREKLRELIIFFIAEAKARALPLITEDITPIKSILIGDNKIAVAIKEQLMQKGLFVSCIRPPTVPKGTARLRISLNCLHEKKDLIYLLDLVAHLHDSCK